jgi:hypothetical protein
MIPALHHQAEAETRAAIEGVLLALTGPELPAELAVTPFRVYGDALRLGLDAPRELRDWAQGRSPSTLDGVLRSVAEALAGPLPPPEARSRDLDPMLGAPLRARDEAESVLHAVRRTWLPRPLSQLEGYSVCIGRCADVDQALGKVLSRKDVLLLLGVRAAFGAAWAQKFPDEADGDAATVLEAVRGIPPTPEMIARYVERGALRELVERTAAESTDFADQLATTIEAIRAVGDVGLIASRWWKRHTQASALVLRAPPLAVAAAAGEEPRPEVHRLGRVFASIDVEAALHVGPREVTLEIDFDKGTLARAELGSERREIGPEDESCRIPMARGTGPLRMRIVACTGEEIAEDLTFESPQA